MIHFLHYHPISAAALLVFLAALLKGGAPERLGAAAMILEWVGEVVADRFGNFHHIAIVPTLFLDFCLAAMLLGLALKYGRLWIGAAMILQSVMLAMHAMVLSDDAPGYYLYATCLNATTCLLLFSLLTGSVSAWRRRRALRASSPRERVTSSRGPVRA